MTKYARLISAVLIALSITLTGCYGSTKFSEEKPGPVQEAPKPEIAEQPEEKIEAPAKPETDSGQNAEPTPPPIDLAKVKPNEAGKIMVVMFHNFVEAYKSGDKLYTTTFEDFRKLLQTLYDKNYRLISLSDYLSNNISVPAGCIPMIFTFDDGTPGQFNLVEENGNLTVNNQSAVGIMEEFNKAHPDFGLKGTFYVNLGLGTFQGKGTVAERLKYLVDRGFEIGNHTYTHVHLNKITGADKIQQEIGENQKKMYELIPGYKIISFSLPYGLPSKELQAYVAKGEYEGVAYEHQAIMEVGWDPAFSPVSKKFNPLSTHRVRASGIEPVDADLAWWLEKLSRDEQYVSDGDPATITVPKSREENIDKARLNNKQLVIY